LSGLRANIWVKNQIFRPDMTQTFWCTIRGPGFAALRDEIIRSILDTTCNILHDADIPLSKVLRVKFIASQLFKDDACWPLGSSRYYLGLTPPLSTIISQQRIRAKINIVWHTASIRLAGRIWGEWQRRRARLNRIAARRDLRPTIELPDFLGHLQ
jgi:hypothetical protein